MAGQYDDRNRGQIWKNEKKRPDKQDPDFTGSLNVDGKDYWVSAWKRKEGAAERAPALSFTVKQKDSKPAKADAPAQTHGARASFKDDMDGDEIPFSAEFR